MKAEYIAPLNNDLSIVNAAKVSFDKEASWYTPRILASDEAAKLTDNKHFDAWMKYQRIEQRFLSIQDFGLIDYLNRENHFTPFTHNRLTFEASDYIMLHFDDMTPEHYAGLVVTPNGNKVRHSLWGWKNLIADCMVKYEEDAVFILKTIRECYPAVYTAFIKDLDFTDEDLNAYRDVKNIVHLHDDIYPEMDINFIDITMRETVPIFVARQRFKHKVGFTENEVSRRYVSTDPEFFEPETWRAAPDKSIKQGSSKDEVVKFLYDGEERIEDCYDVFIEAAENLYKEMLRCNVAPEQARMVLPQSMYTSYYVTGNFPSWYRAIGLRNDSHAQYEIEILAKQWEARLTEIGLY